MVRNLTDPIELLQRIVDSDTPAPDLIEQARDVLRGWRSVDDHAEIPLTGNVWAKISTEDLPRVLKHKWFCVGKQDCRVQPAHPRAKIKGSAVPLGRFILHLNVGDDCRADHINYDNLDNRRENLRVATKQQSALHRRGRHRRTGGTKSKFKGVYWDKSSKCWRVLSK